MHEPHAPGLPRPPQDATSFRPPLAAEPRSFAEPKGPPREPRRSEVADLPRKPGRPELSIVLPCLNEAETLETCIRKAQDYLAREGVDGEIVVGDNGSSDGSQDIARRCGARVVDVAMRGYGAALYHAVLSARGVYCIMADSDDSYDLGDLGGFLERLRGGAELVMGDRFAGGIAPGAMPWKNRYIGNPLLSGAGRFLFRSPARDFHCGIRGLTRAAFLRMDLRTTGMEFASEMVIKATLLGLRIEEVPTTLRPDGRSRAPHLRPYRDGWRHLRFMLLFSPNWLFFYPGLMLTVVGLVFGGALLVTPVQFEHVRFSIATLIYCAAAIEIGVQAVLFALLSQAYAAQEGLHPAPPQVAAAQRALSLERGILAGLLLAAIGFGLLVYALVIWRDAGFGHLDVEFISRISLGSSLAISLGLELIFSSFLLSTLQLNIRPFAAALAKAGSDAEGPAEAAA
jgi:glycosyltransferase involved in cell wall biosynthesis